MGQEALVSSASAEAKRVCDEGEECSPFSSANSFSLKGAASKLIKAGRVFRTMAGTEPRTCLSGLGAVLRNLAPFLRTCLDVELF